MAPGLEARIDALYAAPPAGFTSARRALVAELEAAGDPLARSLAERPRPTVAVWAVNLAARRAPEVIAGLVLAADEALRASARALGGAGGREVLAAQRALEGALDVATGRACAAAAAEGRDPGPNVRARVRQTLRALALGGAAARERLRAGRVEREAASTGLEALEALRPIRAPRAAEAARAVAAAPDPAGEARVRERQERQERDQRQAREQEARRRLAAAEAALARAEREARRLRERRRRRSTAPRR